MMKRKVSVIWVVVLALIAIAACAFAAVTYYRCEKQPEPQFPENELLRILDAGSDAEGVTEELKRTRQMEWVQRCNNIHNRAEEIVLHDIIYSYGSN